MDKEHKGPEALKRLWTAAREKGGDLAARAGALGRRAAEAWGRLYEKARPGLEKAGQVAAKANAAIARHPVSPLLYVTLLALLIGTVSFNGMYTSAYTLEGDGVPKSAVSAVPEGKGESPAAYTVMGLAGRDVVPYAAAPAPKSVTGYAISVNGTELGVASSEDVLYQILDEAAQPWLTDSSVSYDFADDVEIYPVELPPDTQFDEESLREILTSMSEEAAYYEVKAGDSFNRIAYSLDMTPNTLSVLNPDIENVNKLWVGQKLLIQQKVPYLTVICHANETYREVIKSPVEYIETSSLYVGSTSVKTQGHDGMALVNADVTYVNGVEAERTVLISETLEEATTTVMYTGTTPRPKTASNGYYIWPVQGRITSKFGSRVLGGQNDYHLGIDIGVPTGTTVKAADGGKVTFAGPRGSYGNLVIITHDNGQQTYYAHNSVLLVKAGQRVYQGQAIAKSGATGNVTGPHCHFEIRVNGAVVNPLNYLP